MIGLDTNVVVRYIMQDDPRQAALATRFVESLTSATPGYISLVSGAFYVFAGCHGVIGKRTAEGVEIRSDADFVGQLVEKEGVALVAGSAFGLGPYFRLSYATATHQLVEGCERIRRFCEALIE